MIRRSDLLPAALRLVALIEAGDWHLSTGFLGTPRLLPVLTHTRHTDVAYRLPQQRTFPSWGYQIDRGSTTMWERWESIRPYRSFQHSAMNSFNHYEHDRRALDPDGHAEAGDPHARHLPAPGGRLRGLPSRLRHAPLHRLTPTGQAGRG